MLNDQLMLRRRTWPASIGSLLLSVVICFGAAGLGAAATTSSVTSWYRTILKPTWTPPDWIFGPVWTVLYLLMAVSAWLVWQSGRGTNCRRALTWFGVQLGLNSLWSVLFFGLHRPGWAFAEILLLWLAIAATAFEFRPHSVIAAWLLAPYLAWSSFAAGLNCVIWQMNS